MNQPVPINIDQSRILVVDDDEIIRKLLRRVLERSGFVVDEAGSGEAAIERIQAHRPDLILLDVVMDGIDGFITCRKIKNSEGMDEVPIIFVTGRSDTGSIVEGLDAGGSDYITKPINRHEALARIRNHLKMRVLMKFQREFIDGLKKANLAKNRIIGIASHDLRNPIASIRGLSEFLEEAGPLTPDQREIAYTIQSTSDSMLHLVDELLDLSVIESGEERSDCEPCSILEIVSSSLNIYQFTANKKSIKLLLEDEGEIPAVLLLDKMQFRRLVDNVLSNAVKYSPTDTSVTVFLRREGDLVKIIVEDEGPGIPEGEMHKLFTDFGKTSVQPTGNETSTGLGLSICKKIVESHHGRIYAANREGQSGAVFTIEFDVNKLAVRV
ncbi:hybrid sensor histidine kinase/response regulator [Coraliomargarita algicola]|uniref:histidine kinase n=1 Tax=Coraliomargarita algicola TaxID=3092156 RepID=A0ABZ0RFT0_9BACT|nr:hybrid sensor histidine kinase/response regulator [Coraliomargarita sp. J2-16]WPJ94368.1 hybrid sensor histidine kinase/response regulator [Coraliomargarita sp. J2-16]